jgi:hypothetical protein
MSIPMTRLAPAFAANILNIPVPQPLIEKKNKKIFLNHFFTQIKNDFIFE